MAGSQVVLVTGVADYWGARVCARLAAEPDIKVFGLDASDPTEEIEGLEFVRADVRSGQLVDLLRSAKVSAVCHLKFRADDGRREASANFNVDGAANVIDACAEAGVERLVIKSSTAVYGARPDNSAFLSEETPLRGSRKRGALRDRLEIEARSAKFRARKPGPAVVTLRFANIVGPTAETPMTRFLNRPVPMILLGFDPMMQLIHEDDVVEALVHALLHEADGAYNVAAEGAIPLSRLLRLARKLPLPVFHLFAYAGEKRRDPRRQARFAPFEWDYLRYPWLGDLTRMREVLAFTPKYDAVEALAYLRPPENEEE